MTTVAKLYDRDGTAAGEKALSEAVFGVPLRTHLLFDAVLMQRANRREGSAKTKEKGEVRGGGKKPYRQKGTGYSRQGSSRSPLQPGGGTTFGPLPRSYGYRLPAQVRQEALRVALSQASREGKLFVVKDLRMEKPKTKDVVKLLETLKLDRALVVDTGNAVLGRSVRNLPHAKYMDARGLNVFDILKFQNLVMSSGALEQVEKRLAS